MWSTRVLVAALIGAVLVGCLFGYFGRQMFAFKATAELNVGDFFKFLFGVIAALYVAEAVKSRTGDRRREKDMLIEKVDEVIAAYRAIADCFYAAAQKTEISADDRTNLSRQFKLASAQLTTIENLIPKCRPSRKVTKSAAAIRDSEMAFKRLVTGSGKRYAPGALMSGSQMHRELDECLLFLKIDINVMP
jgi:hypothetical protein